MSRQLQLCYVSPAAAAMGGGTIVKTHKEKPGKLVDKFNMAASILLAPVSSRQVVLLTVTPATPVFTVTILPCYIKIIS
jgi:hypothetical protein